MMKTLSNTFKQIRRSGWIAWSSIAVMALAFFVGSVFAGVAYLAHLYIQAIESRDSILVFFEVGTDRSLIDRLQNKWDGLPDVKSTSYFTEEEAYWYYRIDAKDREPIQAEFLERSDIERIPSSIDIRLNSLDALERVASIVVQDVNAELALLEYDPKDPPIIVTSDDETLNEAREIFLFIRIAGIVLITLLFVIIFFFILMTVEYRTYNRMEEIGVMQLVGGSLGYIRAPFILEGSFYGAVGALVSAAVIIGITVFLFSFNPDSTIARFMADQVQLLSLPSLSLPRVAALVVGKTIAGALLGALISYTAIRRYIK